jgi:uncharacterized lipoprotein YmbA
MKARSAPSRRRHRLAALAALLLAACSAPKPERFHSLLASVRPSASAPSASAPFANAPVIIDVLPVSVPPLVDQPQWVVRAADDTLQVLEQERWAAPLREELRSALAEQLVARWGAVNLQTLPQPASTVWRVRVDVQRFESMASGETRLESTWSVLPPQRDAKALVCTSSLRESAADPGAPALAAAHRRALVRLADAIGQNLAAMQKGEAGRCDG